MMRFAVDSDDGHTVAAHTGRCRGFLVFDVDHGRVIRKGYRENRFTAHARGTCEEGAAVHEHHHLHSPLVTALADYQALVTGGLGPRLIADLHAFGIEPFIRRVSTVEAAAEGQARGGWRGAADGGTCGRHS